MRIKEISCQSAESALNVILTEPLTLALVIFPDFSWLHFLILYFLILYFRILYFLILTEPLTLALLVFSDQSHLPATDWQVRFTLESKSLNSRIFSSISLQTDLIQSTC